MVSKIKTSVVNLNLFNKQSQDPLRILREHTSTWLFIILFIDALCILIFYTCLSSQTITKTIQSPTQEEYEVLINQFPTALQCPCTVLSIPYKDFIQIEPVFHQICQSDFVQPWWYRSLTLNVTAEITAEFLPTVSSHFRTLATFCETANLTIVEAIRQFSSRLFVNAQPLSFRLFNSQIDWRVENQVELHQE